MNMALPEFFLGLDSTDSRRGGCTTHVAALSTDTILESGGEFLDYPHLVRLNPDVPFKTRGNGAVGLHFRLNESSMPVLFESIVEIISREADLGQINSDPGLVILRGPVPSKLRSFANRCLHEVVSLKEAEDLLGDFALYAKRWKLGRGLIGALAAIGLDLPRDYIFELVAYRHPRNYGKPRRVNPASIASMDKATKPKTLNNLDYESRRILITPHGPDPVLLGIRGESPEVLLSALEMLQVDEEIERYVIFRSNECTDSHLTPINAIAQLKPHTPATLQGIIASQPRIFRGGHVFVDMVDDTGVVTLAAYEPTGRFREAVLSLIPDDVVAAAGGVKSDPTGGGLTLNLESLTPVKLVRARGGNPSCPACGNRMESLGRGKGYRCRRCRRREGSLARKSYVLERTLVEGVKYQPPPSAHRHLTRPLSRVPLEKRRAAPMIADWYSRYSPLLKIRRSIS